MKKFVQIYKFPAIISSLFVLPFVVLELVNRRNYDEVFPIPLFSLLWLLAMAFILIFTSVLQNIKTGNSIKESPASLLLRIAALFIIAGLWIGIIVDQLPCFLGIPNCD